MAERRRRRFRSQQAVGNFDHGEIDSSAGQLAEQSIDTQCQITRAEPEGRGMGGVGKVR